MDLNKLLHVLWDARDYIEEYGLGEDVDSELIKRIEDQMDIVEDIIWEDKNK